MTNLPFDKSHSDSQITEQIIGAAYEVFNELGFGFLESVYEKSLAIALVERGLKIECQIPIEVTFRNHAVGNFTADLYVEKKVLVELKSAREISTAHEVQLVNYLTATNTSTGLLVNFGPKGVQVKRKSKDLINPSS